MVRKLTALLLCIAFACILCACAQDAKGKAAELPENSVTDASGAVLAIPQDGAETTIASVYAISVPFIVALRLDEQVVAINYKSKFWGDNVPALGQAGSVGRGVVDMEALATYAPGVLIHRANDPQTVEAVKGMGVAVLCIQAENMDTITGTLELMGEYFGVEDRAAEVTAWMQGKFDKIDGIVQKIPEEERVTAVVMGGELGKVAGGDMLQSWMIEKAGGTCAAADVENNSNWANVGVETLFQWNPDHLFCTSSAVLDYTAEELMADPAWRKMAAVQAGDVAIVPAKIDTWDMPGIACVPGTFWMLHQMYPEYFGADELQAEIDEYYTLMFGRTFDAEYLSYSLD